MAEVTESETTDRLAVQARVGALNAGSPTAVVLDCVNVSSTVVKNPVFVLSLPVSVRFRGLAQAPENTGVTVRQMPTHSEVVVTLPFCLMPEEREQIVIETSPIAEEAARSVRIQRFQPVP